MMAMRDHAKLPYQIKYVRCYLAPRLQDGTYGSWTDVTRHVVESNMGTYKKSIDSDDFDIGFYEESNVTIAFDNQRGDFMEGQGYFDGAIVDRSKIRIIAGYRNIEAPLDASQAAYEVDFEGIIDDRGTSIDSEEENAQFTVLSYSAIISRLLTDPGAVGVGSNFKTAFFNLLNRTEINSLLTVDLDNIDPKVNQVIDDPSWFTGKQLKASINALLLASNSILKIRDNTIYITSREESSTVRFQFFGKGSKYPCNILTLREYHNGLRRTFTRIRVNGEEFDAADEIIDLYGSTIKSIDLGFVSDAATVAAIGNDILDEFGHPKAELEITTDYLGNEVDILDMVTIDNEGTILDESPALYGQAVYGEALYVSRIGGVRLTYIQGFKVLSVTHDYRRYTTTLKLRAIGNRPFDSNAGYRNPIYGQAIYGLSRYANVS